MATLRLALALTICAALGCSSTPDGGDGGASPSEPPGGTAQLRVIVWSTAFRRAVPATGAVSGAGQRFDLDTRGGAQDGQAFQNLAPGLYTVDVESRYDDDEAHRVTGTENVYLEPGAHEEVTVVAVDRPGDN
ncbi:MAG: hypothetical protein R3F62_21415 [Planctomycetota bacterium]